MKDSFLQIVKDASRSSLAVLAILGLLQPFGLNASEGRMLIIGITIINFLCNIIIALFLQPIKDFKIRLACGNIIFIPVFSTVYIMFHSYSQNHCFWDCDLMTYLKVCMWVSFVGVFILVMDIFRYRNDKLQRELEEVRAINALLEEREMERDKNNDSIEANTSETDSSSITIQGNTASSQLQVSPSDIVYIESLSNYADIWYMHEGERKHATLRITMKQLREQLSGYPYLTSCHRAYIVNIDYVVSLSSRTTGNYQLQLLGFDKQIPVSKSNTNEIKMALQKLSR